LGLSMSWLRRLALEINFIDLELDNAAWFFAKLNCKVRLFRLKAGTSVEPDPDKAEHYQRLLRDSEHEGQIIDWPSEFPNLRHLEISVLIERIESIPSWYIGPITPLFCLSYSTDFDLHDVVRMLRDCELEFEPPKIVTFTVLSHGRRMADKPLDVIHRFRREWSQRRDKLVALGTPRCKCEDELCTAFESMLEETE
jgi:hypothetical protein